MSWDVSKFLCPVQGNDKYCIIILNESINKTNSEHVKLLWHNATVRVCVDGGTNFYEKFVKSSNSSQPTPPPDLITGDFDSIDQDLLKAYNRNQEVCVVHTPDQDETDFTKAIKELYTFLKRDNTEIHFIIVIGGAKSERFDHVFANFNTLYKSATIIPHPIVLYCKGSLMWLCRPHMQHCIHIPDKLKSNQECNWCALIPLGNEAIVTTTGLKWNVNSHRLKFGELVSTSNTYDEKSKVVMVDTNSTLVWMMGISNELFQDVVDAAKL